MKLAEIIFQLKSDINYIEKELARSITTSHAILSESSSHLLKAGGKRIRPAFVLLSAKAGEYDIGQLKYLAVALELIHMATLVHDDVIDDAEKRRGQQTVKSKWDNRIAMYTGDYILAEALISITHLENPRVHQIFSRAIVEMCIGEIEQIKEFNDWNQGLRDYLRRIKRKTALLIAISCQLGAVVANASEQAIQALYNYGYNVGMAFQITDDILDFVGDEKKLGKPAGSDLRQGNITLPALYCFQHADDSDLFRQLLVEDGTSLVRMEEIIEFVRQSNGIVFAQDLADRYIKKALYWLKELPDGKYKQTLQEIAQFIGKRQF
jgi:heptaprenyl diphosphate synthase